MTEEKIKRAFLLGIMVTREGFNGECVSYGHLAPDEIRADMGEPEGEWMHRAKKSIAVTKLCDMLEAKLNEQLV